MTLPDPLVGLPNVELIAQGLETLRSGDQCGIGALLVAIAAPRLRTLGLELPPDDQLPDEPELHLYRLVSQTASDGYARYNALVAGLVSFAQALEQRLAAARRAQAEGLVS